MAVVGGAAAAARAVKARRWCFTMFVKNLQTSGFLTLEDWATWAKVQDWVGVKYLVFQRENATTTQTEHVQGYIHFSVQKRRDTVNKLLLVQNLHLEIAKGTPNDNRAYCTEAEKRVAETDFFEHGECPGGQGSKLAIVAATIKEHGLKRAIEDSPQTYITNGRGMRDLDRYYKRQKVRSEKIEVVCIYGESGSGKSWWAKKLFDPGHTYTMPAVPKNGNSWFDGYDNERTLVIDEMSGRIEFELFKNMLDPLDLQIPVKGDYTPALWDTVIITTNNHPSTWYPNDIDPWGLDTVSPVQRRIHVFIEAHGNYNKGDHWYEVKSWVNSNESGPVKELPLRADESVPEPVDAQSDAAPSNAVPTASDPPLDELLATWLTEDEAAAMDFMPADWIPTNTTYDGDNEDLGDLEPIGGEDLFNTGADVF